MSYRVRAFIDFLVERFTGTPAWDRDCETIQDETSIDSH
jgi:hypothetical protein